MHQYQKSFMESKDRLDREDIISDLQTENHLIQYLLQNQKLPGKYRSRDFNPSYNIQDAMDFLEYVYPEYSLNITSTNGLHQIDLTTNNIASVSISKKSKWLAKAIFMAMVEDFYHTYEWPKLD